MKALQLNAKKSIHRDVTKVIEPLGALRPVGEPMNGNRHWSRRVIGDFDQ